MPRSAPPTLRELVSSHGDVLTVIALGGAVGCLIRYAVSEALPHARGEIAWSTFLINVSGGLALGVLMVFVIEVWPPHRYLRPFLGVGVLGGYTTFSTYLLDAHGLLAEGETGRAARYLFGTLMVGLLAVWLGIVATQWLLVLTRHVLRAGEADLPVDPDAPDEERPR